MNKKQWTARATALIFALGGMTAQVAQAAPIVEKAHFLIPGGAGGGWDGTARGVGEALTKSGLLGQATYENMSGGGGGKAIGYLIENAASNHDTLIVNSTPIIIRSLVGRFPHSFRDLTPIAGVIGDYATLVVKADSPIQSFSDLVALYKKSPNDLAIAGGSVPGSMDHLVPAMAFQAAGADPKKVNYLPFDAGGKAMASLLSGEADALSTGFGEALEFVKAGQVRIIAVTSRNGCPKRPKRRRSKSRATTRCSSIGADFSPPPDCRRTSVASTPKCSPQCTTRPNGRRCASATAGSIFSTPTTTSSSFWRRKKKTIGGLMRELGFL